jgi:HPt (histidine-containing phosphotransfer) domain-containing protein
MSVHLPDRNGIATTRLIRDPDSPVLQHDIPIVGLTTRVADATAEDCVAAGMNLCLVRPVEPEVLRQAIERLLKAPTEPEISGGGPRTSALYNRRELLERLDGDETLCRDVVQTFLDGAPPLVEAMYEAALFRDPAQLRRTAHTLADAAANVSAEGIRSLAYRIEHAGRAGELGEVPLLLAELQALLEQLRKLVS